MAIRLQEQDSPANPADSIELHQLVMLVHRFYNRHLVLSIDPSAADGKLFRVSDAFSGHLQASASDGEALTAYLDSLSAHDNVVTPTLDGALETSTPTFWTVRLALRLKSGYSALDCAKALRWADGDADRALARLIETNGYAAYKV